jgi:two-component system response regulator FixJ
MTIKSESSPSLGHVIVIDDDAAVRSSLEAMLGRKGYTVSVHADAQAFLAAAPAPAHAVMLLDMRMPCMIGIDLQAHMKDAGQNLPIIFMSGDSNPDEIITAMKQGAFDFLLKPFSTQSMLDVIARAMQFSHETLEQKNKNQHVAMQLQKLTPRELEVCKWMVLGYSNQQISNIDGGAASTIKLHRARVMAKLDVSTLPELIGKFGMQFAD